MSNRKPNSTQGEKKNLIQKAETPVFQVDPRMCKTQTQQKSDPHYQSMWSKLQPCGAAVLARPQIKHYRTYHLQLSGYIKRPQTHSWQEGFAK